MGFTLLDWRNCAFDVVRNLPRSIYVLCLTTCRSFNQFVFLLWLPTSNVCHTTVVFNKYVVIFPLSRSLRKFPSRTMASLLLPIFAFAIFHARSTYYRTYNDGKKHCPCSAAGICCLREKQQQRKWIRRRRWSERKKLSGKKVLLQTNASSTAFVGSVRSCTISSTGIKLAQWIFAFAAYQHTMLPFTLHAIR